MREENVCNKLRIRISNYIEYIHKVNINKNKFIILTIYIKESNEVKKKLE
jgi:hypothetical protein